MSTEIPTITTYTRNDFRKWLKKHHKKETRVATILHKRHTGKSAPTQNELMREAICFGWIDTTLKRIDEDTYIRHWAKRTHNSRWSDNTIRYAQELIKQGKMTKEGMKYYELGLTKPTHDHGIPKNPDMPMELTKALAKNKKAKSGFEAFPKSTKKMYYRWILRAKLPPTREKRVRQIIQAAEAKNKNLLNQTQKANT